MRRDGDGDSGQTEVVPFEGSGNGTGIEHVFAHVGAVVDAGDDHIGTGVEVAGQGEMDTVGGGAVHAPDVGAVFGDTERAFQGKRMTGPATIAVGGDNGEAIHFMVQGIGQAAQSRGKIAVVVGQ